ncbi:hypothetical protein ACHHYP_20731 [Achlya hypogyna]|uniref:EamA domain-containing protein n=1 Tax=Achlya hypogyna TaxID=1202772 RepID=A0A1V9YDB8_ACHHY|nr:hypothetical protein ACHHYP_20731 [Achlya hypogyna]
MESEAAPLLGRTAGLLYVASSAFMFSLMSCAVKYESETMSTMESVFWRSLFSWIITLASMVWHGSKFSVAKEFWWYLTLRCVAGFSSMALGFWAMTQLALADASVIIFTSPRSFSYKPNLFETLNQFFSSVKTRA